MESNLTTRRNFLKKSVMVTGVAATGSAVMATNPKLTDIKNEKLPREVWIASFSQNGISAKSPRELNEQILKLLGNLSVYKPDIVCLPEAFPLQISGQSYSLAQKLEISAESLAKFADFSKQNNCYTICPVYTTENGLSYNAAVIFDRRGTKLGEYRKIRLTTDEIESGLTPGPGVPPVFQTDFGIIGVQICFDLLWDDSWKSLREQGAEIVFWPSAYGGGQVVNSKAWQHKYVTVSSTRSGPSMICDIPGEMIAQTGKWDKNLVCAPVNLEKAFLHTWPFCNRFNEIKLKYGRKVKITTYHDEEWSIIESVSPDVKVADILTEFDLRTFEQHKQDAEMAQQNARKKAGVE